MSDWSPSSGKELFWYIVIILALAIPAAVYACSANSAETECLQKGYASSRVTWSLDAYCIRRVDQTDVVVPLEEVKP